ncbi:MAG: response regulator [Hyphomicrobiaceae bacterium]
MTSSDSTSGGDILAQRNKAKASTATLSSIRDVLIVEDEDFDADRLQATLRVVLGQDAKIRRAATIASALDMVIEAMPDIVLLDDYLKPNDTASQTIPFVRRAGFNGPIVIISGEIDRRRKFELQAIGAAAALHKEDVDSASVSKALNTALSDQRNG